MASEYRDLETGMHIKRISHYSALLGKLSVWTRSRRDYFCTPLHYMILVNQEFPWCYFAQTWKLDDKEFKLEEHTTIGGLMLQDGERYPIIKSWTDYRKQHHKKYNGSGYPLGLSGEYVCLCTNCLDSWCVWRSLI